MYFEQDKILDVEKCEAGRSLFNKLSDEEKPEYIKQLFFNLRQQAFYAGLDMIEVYKLFQCLAASEKDTILRSINMGDDTEEDEDKLRKNVKVVKCSGSKSDFNELVDLLEKLKDKPKKTDSSEIETKSDLN